MLSNGFRLGVLVAALIAVAAVGSVRVAQAQDSGTTTSADGEEKPYKIQPDGTVSWAVFSGFRRFNSECFVCHGPDGVGSTFAPALIDSLKVMPYETFLDTVVNGKTEVNTATQKKMPSLGANPNVMCYIDDIYAYLKARSDGVLGRGRPAKHEPKSPEAAQAETACMGG